jgi:hypothetical protein
MDELMDPLVFDLLVNRYDMENYPQLLVVEVHKHVVLTD